MILYDSISLILQVNIVLYCYIYLLYKELCACSGFGFAHDGCWHEATNILGFWDRWYACGCLPFKVMASPWYETQKFLGFWRILNWTRCVVRNAKFPGISGFVPEIPGQSMVSYRTEFLAISVFRTTVFSVNFVLYSSLHFLAPLRQTLNIIDIQYCSTMVNDWTPGACPRMPCNCNVVRARVEGRGGGVSCMWSGRRESVGGECRGVAGV